MIVFLEPPAQYDRPYPGRVVEQHLSRLQVMATCHGPAESYAIFEQFNGTAGAAYFIAGFGMAALASTDENLVVVSIRPGLELRLGYNVGYLNLRRLRPGTHFKQREIHER